MSQWCESSYFFKIPDMTTEVMMPEDEEVLPPTLTPKDNEETALCTPSETCKLPWGRLVTCQMFLQNVGKLVFIGTKNV